MMNMIVIIKSNHACSPFSTLSSPTHHLLTLFSACFLLLVDEGKENSPELLWEPKTINRKEDKKTIDASIKRGKHQNSEGITIWCEKVTSLSVVSVGVLLANIVAHACVWRSVCAMVLTSNSIKDHKTKTETSTGSSQGGENNTLPVPFRAWMMLNITSPISGHRRRKSSFVKWESSNPSISSNFRAYFSYLWFLKKRSHCCTSSTVHSFTGLSSWEKKLSTRRTMSGGCANELQYQKGKKLRPS